jgi:aryl-alcohol dehydrogenase-like predicted oxidoreductase
MEMRSFGRTGLELSVLGFGCGAVGGLMVRDPRDQERTIARAIGAGVNYFDTAVQYGNGESQESWSHPATTETSQRGRRHKSSVAERQFRPHCLYRGDITRT